MLVSSDSPSACNSVHSIRPSSVWLVIHAVIQMKHARELGKNYQEVIPKDTTDRELFKKAGRYVALTVLLVKLCDALTLP